MTQRAEIISTVTSHTRPLAPAERDWIYETDTDQFRCFVDGEWVRGEEYLWP